MKALLLRDFDLRKRMLPFWGAYSLFFFLPALAIADWRPSMSFALALVAILVGVLWVIGGAKVEGSSSDLLIASFPVRRRELADSKFLAMLLAAAFGAATTLAWGLALGLLGLPIRFEGLDWLVPVRILAGLGLLSWLLPLYIRYGADFTRLFMVIGLAIAVVLQMGLALVLGARGSEGARIFRGILDWYGSRPIVARNLVLLGAGLAVGVASWLVARRVAARKEY